MIRMIFIIFLVLYVAAYTLIRFVNGGELADGTSVTVFAAGGSAVHAAFSPLIWIDARLTGREAVIGTLETAE